MTDFYPPDMMPDETWQIIDAAKGDIKRLQKILADQPPDVLRRFFWNVEEAGAYLSYAPYVDESNSEDTNRQLGHHVVSQGRARYKAVFDDPTKMPRTATIFGFSGAALLALEDVHGIDEDIRFPAGFAQPPTKLG